MAKRSLAPWKWVVEALISICTAIFKMARETSLKMCKLAKPTLQLRAGKGSIAPVVDWPIMMGLTTWSVEFEPAYHCCYEARYFILEEVLE